MASARLDGRAASAASACAVSLRSCSAVATEEASLARLPSAWTWLCSHARPREISGDSGSACTVATHSSAQSQTGAFHPTRADDGGFPSLALMIPQVLAPDLVLFSGHVRVILFPTRN